VSAAACALVALGGASASAAKPASSGGQAMSSRTSATAGLSGGWGAGVAAALPANGLVTSESVLINSVSCPSPGNCSAVGEYYDRSGLQGLLLTEAGGQWSVGVEAVLPANAATANPEVRVNSVSCSPAGNCTGVGSYFDSSGNMQGLLLTETEGTWATGVEAPLPANTAGADLDSVSCASPGNCTVVGAVFLDGSDQGLLLTETAGSWATGVKASLPADAPPGTGAYLDSVSCASAGNCTAVGATYPESGEGSDEGLLVTETGGNWEPGVEAPLPANARSGLEVDSVSCPSAANCSAVGDYADSSSGSGQGLLLTETAGSWAAGVEAPLPADVATAAPEGAEFIVNSVSCASAGNCAAVGSYVYSSVTGGPPAGVEQDASDSVLFSEIGGTWAPGVFSPLPAYATGAVVLSVSCSSAGNCGAVGSYGVNTGGSEALLVSESGGNWATALAASLPPNASPSSPNPVLLDSVSCPSDGNCGAAGYYSSTSGIEGLLIGGEPARVMLDVARKGTGSGTVSSNSTEIDCGSTCSASFDAGISLTLTATPSAGSRFSGWSGGGCSGTSSCPLNTDLSDQTVTATFSLLPKPCIVPKLKGETLMVARRALRTGNCTVGRITHATSQTIKKGHVISQKPQPGRHLHHRAAVSLLVSTGQHQRL
jgi:Divergent InlB B-repeat domain/PASTA domain